MDFDEFWPAQEFGYAACDADTLARKVWGAAVAAAREACANVCDEVAKDYMHYDDVTAREIKKRITKRSNAKVSEGENGK